ncbi:PfkB family carbohydrate kinase [Alsobacter soli]|uniref:PfkB family carbohydrate kinase n=1 Tax=Alsobacter soli TaxID=2109933 RepID=UPI00130499B4|nr:PfkB family carbohydrate kinase [Alsobacter soli]
MKRVFVLGNATVDCVQTVARLPVPGETLLCDSLERCPGGKGLNQAIACARTGAATVLAAPLGGDRDGAVLATAASAEANLEARWIASSAPTDYSAIWVASDGENMIVSSAEAARALTEAGALDALADFAAGDVLLMQGNLDRDVTVAACRLAAARGGLRVLNTAPIAWDMAGALPLFDLVVANAVEAATLVGGAPHAAAQALSSAPGRAAVVTLGAEGAILSAEGATTRVAAPAVSAVDTAGAGDVLVGVLVGRLAQGAPLKPALALGIAAASLAVTRRGTVPSFPTRDELARLQAG